MASDASADDVLVVHTAQVVLSPQNFMAFREFLAAMWSRGEREQSWPFWVLCPLVEHLPAPSVPISDITIGDGALPVHRVVCTQAGCARCEAGRGGYQFRFLGLWTRRAVLVPSGMGFQEAGERCILIVSDSGGSNLRDADFAFAFSSYEDALALAGRPVADVLPGWRPEAGPCRR